mmetsp:Transcript_27904/g.39639  ORF Transcript_27904/g.39639 Transcript_27904/m.39639 type:complete len:180 (+) Transcript_27904:1-540(+)
MKYYPIVQTVLRSGAAWSELNNYQYQSFASELLYSICSPSTGACYFFLFLYMQPKAWLIFRSIIFCKTLEDDTTSPPLLTEAIRRRNNTIDNDSLFYMSYLDDDELEEIIDLHGHKLSQHSQFTDTTEASSDSDTSKSRRSSAKDNNNSMKVKQRSIVSFSYLFSLSSWSRSECEASEL